MVILEMPWLRRPDDKKGRRFSAPSSCGSKSAGNTDTGNPRSPSGEEDRSYLESARQDVLPVAMSIDVSSFRDTKNVMAKLLPIRVPRRQVLMTMCFRFFCCIQYLIHA